MKLAQNNKILVICALIIFLLLTIKILNNAAISDELDMDAFAEEFERTDNQSADTISRIEIELSVEMKLNVFYNQFKNNKDDYAKFDAIYNAATDLKENCKPLYKYILSESESKYKIEVLKTVNKYKFQFADLIIAALDDKDETVIIRAIEASINLDKKDKIAVIDKCFKMRKENILAHLLPILFNAPEEYKPYIRRILLSENLELKLTGYKYLINIAPKLFELVCLGMFDDDAEINRFVLANYKLYPEKGRQLIYYGLKSDKKTVVEYAKALLKELRD